MVIALYVFVASRTEILDDNRIICKQIHSLYGLKIGEIWGWTWFEILPITGITSHRSELYTRINKHDRCLLRYIRYYDIARINDTRMDWYTIGWSLKAEYININRLFS